MAHASGGGVDINLFHQDAAFNRGWSAQGREYRAMERYCARHAGTFCFARPIYTDDTARPAELEFGVLRPRTSSSSATFAAYSARVICAS
jgi:hypothetical protein